MPCSPEQEVDSCYLCEIGKEGLWLPMPDQTVLICHTCVLESIWMHPKLSLHRKEQDVDKHHRNHGRG